MRRFWDARAREDATFFAVGSGGGHGHDVERLWLEGERALDELLALLGARIWPGDTMIDLGCGVGRLTRALAARCAFVHAIDVSPEMLARAEPLNAHLPNVQWHQGDGVSLVPLESEAADGLISHGVFQHLPDPAIAYGYVAEIGRVLRPGGWAGLEVSNDPEAHREPRRRLGGLLRRGRRDAARLGAPVELDALRAAAAAAGLEVTRVTGAGTASCCVRLERPAADAAA
jgi:SAM-dependent methyltransferase